MKRPFEWTVWCWMPTFQERNSWLLDHVRGEGESRIRSGDIDSYLVWMLTGGDYVRCL